MLLLIISSTAFAAEKNNGNVPQDADCILKQEKVKCESGYSAGDEQSYGQAGATCRSDVTFRLSDGSSVKKSIVGSMAVMVDGLNIPLYTSLAVKAEVTSGARGSLKYKLERLQSCSL